MFRYVVVLSACSTAIVAVPCMTSRFIDHTHKAKRKVCSPCAVENCSLCCPSVLKS